MTKIIRLHPLGRTRVFPLTKQKTQQPRTSHRFHNFISSLANKFHVVSRNYLGFGNTAMPDDPVASPYTFERPSGAKGKGVRAKY